MAESIKETNTGNSDFDGVQELAKNIEGLNITDPNKVCKIFTQYVYFEIVTYVFLSS